MQKLKTKTSKKARKTDQKFEAKEIPKIDGILEKIDGALMAKFIEQKPPAGRWICICNDPECNIGPFDVWYTGG